MLTTFFSVALPSMVAHAATDDFPHFMDVSRRLTGFDSLDASFGRRLYAALSADVATFHDDLARLDPADEQGLAQSALAKPMLTGWFRGQVGSGRKSQCIAYVPTLENRVVADILRPPSYAYGAYGSWRTRPQSA